MSEIEKVMDRVKKMLALGNCEGATEAERETALRMAYKILAKHNLSMSDLPADSIVEVRLRNEMTISADKWSRNVCQSVAKLFFCHYFFKRTNTSGKDIHVFVGLQSNTVTAMNMSDFLVKAIKREARRLYKSPTSPEGRSFCVGTMATIHERVEAMIADTTESEPGTAVAIINLHKSEQELNKKFLEDEGTSLKVATRRADNSLRYGAFMDGKDFGGKVSLNKQVEHSVSSHKQLGA